LLHLSNLIIWSIIGTGISSLAVQLVTIREFLTQFHGNEITISLVLFSWLLLTGIGSLIAKPFARSSVTAYTVLISLVALFPLPQLILIRAMRETIFIHGTSPGFYSIFLYIVILISFYCLLVGFVLPYALKVLQQRHYPFTSGHLYITDNIGDISGGILFSFFLVYWVKPFVAIAVTSSLLILTAMMIQYATRRYAFLVCTAFAASLFYAFSFNAGFETRTLVKQFGEILRYTESPYGRIVISREGPQHTFWESGLPLYSDADIVNSEEKVHYPLSQLERVESVLLVSGGLGETLSEVSKYKPKRIDYVELDPHLTQVAIELGFVKQIPGLRVINGDGRLYVKTTLEKYDAVIVDLPEPDTFQINRFFTNEFFSLAKRILTRGGIFSFSLDYSPNYLSDIQREKLSAIYQTARLHFKHVLILPGERAFFLSSDAELSPDIPALLARKSIQTSYVEGFYYGNVTKERIADLQSKLDRHALINADFEPRIMSILFQEWFMKYGTSPKIFILVLVALTLVYLIFLRREEYVLFSTGLTTMGMEMLIIFSFQVMYGYVYLKVGAIVTAFLLGLLPGALVGNSQYGRTLGRLVVSEVTLLCLLLVFFTWSSFFRGELPSLCFLAYGFLFSFFCGYQFPLAASIIGEKESPAASCFAADLTGAAVGTLVTGTLLLPLRGLQSAIFFLILVKISSNIVVLSSKKKGNSP
jgi:spermidine synthase